MCFKDGRLVCTHAIRICVVGTVHHHIPLCLLTLELVLAKVSGPLFFPPKLILSWVSRDGQTVRCILCLPYYHMMASISDANQITINRLGG